MGVCLQAEIDWINNNVDQYDSTLHAQAVINNITKRYELNEIIKLVKAYGDSRKTKDQLALLDYVEGKYGKN